MAASTTVRAGQLVTSTEAETQYTLAEIQSDGAATVTVFLELVSGSVKWGVREDTDVLTPALDSNYRTFSTAGDKAIFTVARDGTFNLRAVGVATWSITY